jgi:hypothetical protein
MKFEVLTAVNIRSMVFWDGCWCGLVNWWQHFGAIWCLYLQGITWREQVPWNVGTWSTRLHKISFQKTIVTTSLFQRPIFTKCHFACSPHWEGLHKNTYTGKAKQYFQKITEQKLYWKIKPSWHTFFILTYIGNVLLLMWMLKFPLPVTLLCTWKHSLDVQDTYDSKYGRLQRKWQEGHELCMKDLRPYYM